MVSGVVKRCGSSWAIASQAVVKGAQATVVYDVGDAEFTGSSETVRPSRLMRRSASTACSSYSPGSAAASTSRTNTELRSVSTANGKRERWPAMPDRAAIHRLTGVPGKTGDLHSAAVVWEIPLRSWGETDSLPEDGSYEDDPVEALVRLAGTPILS
jgi:hypothetical protein